jgi:uncharacterized PurR-regulated membrane protein YhhQ (DUF165 family)
VVIIYTGCFNIQEVCTLLLERIYGFHVILRTVIISLRSNWVVSVMQILCVFCNTDPEFVNINYVDIMLRRVKASAHLSEGSAPVLH